MTILDNIKKGIDLYKLFKNNEDISHLVVMSLEGERLENLDDYRDSKVILAQIKDTELLAIVEKED